MKKVERREIVDYLTYEERRGAVRESAMKAKAARRVHVAPHLTFLFENRDTVRYQVQEMMRVERMVTHSPFRIHCYLHQGCRHHSHIRPPRYSRSDGAAIRQKFILYDRSFMRGCRRFDSSGAHSILRV